MILLILLLTLFLTGLLILLVGRKNHRLLQAIASAGLLVALVIFGLLGRNGIGQATASSPLLIEWRIPWIPSLNVNFHLGINGLSFWFGLLAVVMGFFAVIVGKPTAKANAFFAAIMWSITGVVGIFLAVDLLLFFFFWEVALFPVYYLMVVHGVNDATKSSLRYIIYTQMSGLILLLSILGLAYANFSQTGQMSFNYYQLSATALPLEMERLIFVGFTLAFLIKLPAFPFHGWLSSIFMSAPVSVLLTSILVKTGVFGLMKFAWPLFPHASLECKLIMMIIGVITVIYGGVLAFGQRDIKALMAYATLSHAGLFLVGIFCQSPMAHFGVLVLTISQALSTAGVLMLIRHLYRNEASVDIMRLGGFWQVMPQFSVILLTFLLAGIGVPAFGNFVGEWLILWGAFTEHLWIAIVASSGIILGAIYSLWLFQRISFGVASQEAPSFELGGREIVIYGAIAIMLLVLGLYPSIILQPKEPHVEAFAQPNVVMASDVVAWPSRRSGT